MLKSSRVAQSTLQHKYSPESLDIVAAIIRNDSHNPVQDVKLPQRLLDFGGYRDIRLCCAAV